MTSRPTCRGTLIRTTSEVAPKFSEIKAEDVTFELEPLFRTQELVSAGLVQSNDAPNWYVATTSQNISELHPWDVAHRLFARQATLGQAVFIDYAEPDLEHEWAYANADFSHPSMAAFAEVCEQNSPDGNYPPGPEFAWHLGDKYTQLESARQQVGDTTGERVRIAHLDTGFDPTHQTRPMYLNLQFQRDILDDDWDARDPGVRGLLRNPGHGTGTAGILAGNVTSAAGFGKFLGGNPFAEVIPVRVANSVARFYTSSMARGIEYAIAPGVPADATQRCHVVSISLGGVASKAWAQAANMAYEAGVVVVAASGNNFGGKPTRYTVYPARFRRVIGVSGVTADFLPYDHIKPWVMQGNSGPASKMRTAIAAFTPNIAWPEMACPGIVDLDGSGTSAATPQVAAAASLWLQKHMLNQPHIYEQGWQIVEAVRYALFTSAKRYPDLFEYFGNGTLRALDALNVSPPAPGNLTMQKPDEIVFPWLQALTPWEDLLKGLQEMFTLETVQLSQRDAALAQMLGNPDEMEGASKRRREDFFEAIIYHPHASSSLKGFLKGVLSGRR